MEDNVKFLAELSATDERIAAIRKNQDEVPSRIEDLKSQIADEKAMLDQKVERREQMKKERRGLESDLTDVEGQIALDRDRELKVRTNEELHALQREVKMAREKQDEIEERILLIMDEISEFEKEIARAEKRFVDFRERAEKEIGELETVIGGAEEELERLESQREEACDRLAPDILNRYNNLLSRGMQPPVARAASDVCTGCNSMIQPQLYNQILIGKKIYSCPICGRLLVHFAEDEEA